MTGMQQRSHGSYYKRNPDEEGCLSHVEMILRLSVLCVKLFLSGELTVGFSMNGDWTPPGFEFEF